MRVGQEKQKGGRRERQGSYKHKHSFPVSKKSLFFTLQEKSVKCQQEEREVMHLSTSCPTNSSSLQIVSPMMVDRKWPTCISLAMFGEEKSTTTLSLLGTGGGRTPFTSMSDISSDTNEGRRETLMKPGPAISH